MDRRAFLQNAATVGGVGMTGACLSTGYSGNSQQNISTNKSTTANCPSFVSDVDTVICADGGVIEDQPVYLEPDTQTFTIVTTNQTVEALGLTLHNQSDDPFVVGPNAWVIIRWTDDNWTESTSGDRTEQSITVAPGNTHTWSLSLTPHPTPHTEETTFITANLEEGTHIFTVIGELQSRDQTRRIECQAQFGLVKKETTRTSTEE